MALEGQEKFESAFETYAKASDYIHTAQLPTKYYVVQYWISKITYRLSILSLRVEEPMASLAHFRRYKMLVDTTFKGNMGARERVPIYYWYWRTLGDIVKARIEKEKETAAEYAPQKTNVDDRDVGSRVEFYELKNELWEMQSQYESVLHDTSKFPRAGNTNQLYPPSSLSN
jgi:hypothetical protein